MQKLTNIKEANNSIISIKNQYEDLKAAFSDEINNYNAEYEKKYKNLQESYDIKIKDQDEKILQLTNKIESLQNEHNEFKRINDTQNANHVLKVIIIQFHRIKQMKCLIIILLILQIL